MALPASIAGNYTAYNEYLGPSYLADPWKTMAPTVLPWALNGFLLGILIHQVFYYFSSNARTSDSRWTLGVVGILMGLACITTVLSWRWNCAVLFTHAGSFWTYTALTYASCFYPLMAVQTTTLNFFYAKRIFALYQRNWFIILPIATLATIVSISAFAMFTKFSQVTLEIEASNRVTIAFCYLYIYPAAVCDMLITGLLLNGLLRAKTGWRTTDALVKRLIWLSFESQLPPTLFAMVVGIHFSFGFSLKLAFPYVQLSGHLYTVCLMRVLNARSDLVENSRSGPTEVYKTNNHITTLGNVRDQTVHVQVETYISDGHISNYDESRHGPFQDSNVDLDAPSFKGSLLTAGDSASLSRVVTKERSFA